MKNKIQETLKIVKLRKILQKYRSMEQNRKPRDKSPMVTLSSTKEARIYNGKKTTSLTSGAGKSGQPLEEE